MAKKSRCSCGRVKSKYVPFCKKCSTERRNKAHAETQAVVTSGICPQCGSKIRRNLSLTGWYQCEQFGAETHRKDPNKPSCSWQGFTE